MSDKKYVTLFGGAMNDATSKEYVETIQIGKILAQKGYIVKSGGYRGMMEAVSLGSTTEGGVAIGYTCKTFPSTKGNQYLTENVICENIYNRLENLIEGSSVFIVQKGGIGTLAEFFLCWDIIRKKPKDARPLILLIGSFWHNVIEQFKFLIPEKEMNCIVIIEDVTKIEKML